MVNNFCTLFDKNYIYRGLAMYFSLKKHSSDFKLWILCMDDAVYDQLKIMKLENIELVKLEEMEDEELMLVKKDRTVSEYCWTISSSLSLYILKINPHFSSITYIDSDLFFYSSTKVIFDELGSDSILIVRHNYSKELAYLERRSGIYNVCMVVIKNDERGVACLKWWRERCIEWCYSRLEEGKFGDQMYLNDWPLRFKGVKVSKNKGVNLAPWNLNKYNLVQKGEQIFVDEDKLVFYHFHSFKMFGYKKFLNYQNFYLIKPQDEIKVYAPYTKMINSLILDFNLNYPDYKNGFDKEVSIKNSIKYWFKRKLFFIFYFKSLLH